MENQNEGEEYKNTDWLNDRAAEESSMKEDATADKTPEQKALADGNAPRVELIYFTGKGAPNERWAAADLLLFTKSTRLELSPDLMAQIQAWPEDKKLQELEYMANTLPSSWEFIDYVFLVSNVSRAYTHQQVRTRTGSYAQQAMRVVNASEFKYIYTGRDLRHDDRRAVIDECVKKIRETYAKLLEMGHLPEDARGVLPTNVATNIVCKFNMRNFVQLAKTRLGGRSQGEYMQVMQRMCDAVLAVHPWMDKFLYGDVGADYFADIEKFADKHHGDDLKVKGDLLKIVHKMRGAQK